jgi:hypothetical protein
MLQILSKLTGFNLDYFTHSEIVKEANRKFSQTWLIVNGEILWVNNFGVDYLECNQGMLLEHQVQSITAWMPEPGIYPSNKENDEYLYLHRIPRRQWLKSFSMGQNYDYKPLTPIDTIEVKALYNYWKLTQEEEGDKNWLFTQKFLVYKIHVVGYIVDLTIVVTDAAFYSEVFDKWHKHYKIILAKPLRDQGVVVS